jgi:general secretion pathway protein L
VQMQRELAQLRQAQGQLSGRDFESIYGRFISVSGVNNAPNAIDFIANEVRLQGVSLNGSEMNVLAPRLEYVGLSVRSEAQALVISHREATARPAAEGKP